MARRAAILSFVSRGRFEASMRASILALELRIEGERKKGSIPNARMDPGISA